MVETPLAKFAVGVKTAERVRPVPLMAPSVPPFTVMSPTDPFQAKVLLGSSENVNVMLAVSPAISVVTLLAILTDGANVSMLIEGEVPAAPLLSAAS